MKNNTTKNSPSSRGSEWRIWDLHVHSPATYGGEYETFIKNAKASKAAVLGINDYNTIRGYEEIVRLGGIPGKEMYPVVEFRMHNVLQTRHDKNGIRINFHIIFNNDPNLLPTISTWLNSLECFDEKGKTILLGSCSSDQEKTFDFEKVVDSLKKIELYKTHALVWLPYNEYGGIDEIDPRTDALFKASLINKSHILGSSSKKQIEFFKWNNEKYSFEEYKSWMEKPMPCIKGSDAHKIDYPFGQLQNAQSQPIEKYCWIKADTTFNGLKQILIEPDRVYIGVEPDLSQRVRNNQTKFIRSISIKKCNDVLLEDIWFNDFHTDINSGLVAIIGNKGGGKSAITDVISLCGNTYQHFDNFSFLTPTKFRKQKPINLSERFEASITWEDSTTATRRLNQNPDKNLPERVKYIPQNFLERLCTNIESDDFEKELKQIIFSHTSIDKRLGKATLDELIHYKSNLVFDEIEKVHSELSKINADIVVLEDKATVNYKKSIENQIKLKESELAAHETIKPQPLSNPDITTSVELVENLTQTRGQISKLELEAQLAQTLKIQLSQKLESLSRSFQYFNNIEDQLKKVKDPSLEYVDVLIKNNIDPDDIFSYTIDRSPIQKLIDQTTSEIEKFNSELDQKNPGSKAFQLENLRKEIQERQEELDKPAKEQQKYLDDLKQWEEQKKSIEGTIELEGTLKFFEGQRAYLDSFLPNELAQKYQKRNELIKQLYLNKVSLVDIRKELFKPVTEFIEDFKELQARYEVKLDVSLELKSFADSFLNLINQAKIGTYSGKEEGYRMLADLVEKARFDSREGFISFTDELLNSLKHDKRTSENVAVDIKTELKKGVELNQLYDFIFQFAYLQPVYNLKLGTKTLQELSPGERGALLLIFYLILDKDDIPLIIDQPEENLDNESVYHILVHFIKKVKEQRQIIIVTHNPNLAIVCDADQIIHMKIDKEKKNEVKFYSSSIEDSVMNKTIIDILEGTLPAFNNRDSKYIKVN